MITKIIKVALNSLLITHCALWFQSGFCQDKNDSTQYVEVAVESELYTKLQKFNLEQIFELIVNAEDILGRNEKQIKEKPSSLKSTLKWNIKTNPNTATETAWLIDTSTGALMINFPKDKKIGKSMVFFPKIVTTEEAINQMKKRFNITANGSQFALELRSGKKVSISALNFPTFSADGILIVIIPKSIN